MKSQLLRAKTVCNSIVLYMAAIMALWMFSFWHSGAEVSATLTHYSS